MRPSLKEVVVKETPLFKLWYIAKLWYIICAIPNYTKKEYTISSGTGKNTISQTPSLTLHFDEWTGCFRQRDTIKLSKNKFGFKGY